MGVRRHGLRSLLCQCISRRPLSGPQFICQIEIHYSSDTNLSDTNLRVEAFVDSTVVKRTCKGPVLRELAF